MKEYTEARHVKNLFKLVDSKYICVRCPAVGPGYDDMNKFYKKTICKVCTRFVGYSRNWPMYNGCPCKILGKHEALKRTYLALEKKGYI